MKKNQKLIALIWLELLGESNFHFGGKFMTEVLEAKQPLRESAEQHGSGCPHLPPDTILFSAICLSSSSREMTALRYIHTYIYTLWLFRSYWSYYICLMNLCFNMFRHTSSYPNSVGKSWVNSRILFTCQSPK